MLLITHDFTYSYSVIVNKKPYVISDIFFYKNGDILTSTGRGYLSNKYGNCIRKIVIGYDDKIYLRRKPKFDGKIFIITKEGEARLYIPAEYLDIHIVKREIKYDGYLFEIYEGEQDIHFENCIKSLRGGREGMDSIKLQYEDVLKDLDAYKMGENEEIAIKNLKRLEMLVKKYHLEKQRVNNLNVNNL